jgi:hypothetical protein
MSERPTKSYWRAYDAFYSKSEVLPANPAKVANVAPKTKPKRSHEEEDAQCIAVGAIRKLGITVHHSPNGGVRDERTGAKLKRMGLSPGFPDLFFPYAKKGFHGLYIEVKSKTGKLSENQIWWRDFLIEGGNAWYLARSANEILKIVREYFELKATF